MADYPLPPWLASNPSETIPQRYTQGASLGTQIAQFQTDTALRQQQLAMHKEDADRNFQLATQQLANQTALNKAKLQLTTQMAARKFAAQQQYQQLVDSLVAGGMEPSQASSTALMRFGPQMGMSGAGLGSLFKTAAPAPMPQFIQDPQTGARGVYVPGRQVNWEKENADFSPQQKQSMKVLEKEYNTILTKNPDPELWDQGTEDMVRKIDDQYYDITGDHISVQFDQDQSQASSSDGAGGIPTVNSQDQYNQLSSGSQYYDPDGNLRRKK